MRIPTIIIGLFLLGACTGLAVVEGTSVIATDKGIGDHLVSIYSGKNCSTVRKEKGLTYCQEDELVPKANIHCYRTLGEVTCYTRPDPFDGRQQKVGENSGNLMKKPGGS